MGAVVSRARRRPVDRRRGPSFSEASLVLRAAIDGLGIALARSVLVQPELDAGSHRRRQLMSGSCAVIKAACSAGGNNAILKHRLTRWRTMLVPIIGIRGCSWTAKRSRCCQHSSSWSPRMAKGSGVRHDPRRQRLHVA